MKKKLIVFLLVSAVILGITACGSNGETTSETTQGATTSEEVEDTTEAKESEAEIEEATEIESEAAPEAHEEYELVVAWWGSQNRNDKFQAALDLYVEENPGVKIETLINGFSDHITALSAAAASQDLPDLAMLQGAYYQPFVEGDLLTDLNLYVDSGALDLNNVDTSILAATTIDGQLFGVCAGTNSPSLIYNKTLLDEHNIKLEDHMSLDEFAEKSAEIYEKTGYRAFISNPSQMIEMLVRGYDKVLYEQDRLGVDSPDELVDYFALLERGLNEGWLMDYSVTVGLTATEEQPLVYGSTPATSSWCSFFNSNQADAMQSSAPEGMELALSTVPLNYPEKSNYLHEAMSWSVPNQGGMADEAVQLLDWWTNSIEANEIIMAEPGVPVSSVVAATIEPSLSGIQQKIFTYITDVITPVAAPSNPPAGAGGNEVINLIIDLEERVYYGELTADEAAQILFDEGNKIMQEAAER